MTQYISLDCPISHADTSLFSPVGRHRVCGMRARRSASNMAPWGVNMANEIINKTRHTVIVGG